ncbi:MAG: DUF1800 domain-containing protein, partial [Nitrospira sp.]|nr:DUF1800 domain-containing protein [Nitrospira sp.]
MANDQLATHSENRRQLQAWWIRRMLETRAPLTEKLTLFWHDHFATGISKVHDEALMHGQNRTIRSLCLGRFGDLVLAMARDPAMIVWLDNRTNRAGSPNENFIRELMEL